MLDTASRTAAGGQRLPLRRPGRRTLTQLAVIAGLLLFALLAIPQLLSLYYIDAMTQVLFGADETATLREDRERPSLGNEAALQNAPVAGAGYFKVPRVIER